MLSFLRKIIPNDFPLRLWYHKSMAKLAAFIYGFPAKDMLVIGVTGTDGKTTTCILIQSILKTAGKKVGLATTTQFAIGDTEWINETHKTTLTGFQLQKLLKQMKKEECTHLIMEVSSHALAQGRIEGIPIDVAVITNVTREHLDFHKTLEKYTQEKLKLFKKLSTTRKNGKKIAVANLDDITREDIIHIPADIHIGYGIEKSSLKGYDRVLHAKDIVVTKKDITFEVEINGEKTKMTLSFVGHYNVYNSLAAIAATYAIGIDKKTIQKGLSLAKPAAGRFEVISDEKFIIAIDYAVTENAFEKLFSTARSVIGPERKIIAVFGACGDRDKGKRKHLGEIASKMCDTCIITDEECYTEDPASIRRMILEGTSSGTATIYEIADRRSAIARSIELAKEGDIILVTGMGSETSMVIGNKKIPWSDRQVIQEELSKVSL